jgi:hypothetical protein
MGFCANCKYSLSVYSTENVIVSCAGTAALVVEHNSSTGGEFGDEAAPVSTTLSTVAAVDTGLPCESSVCTRRAPAPVVSSGVSALLTPATRVSTRAPVPSKRLLDSGMQYYSYNVMYCTPQYVFICNCNIVVLAVNCYCVYCIPLLAPVVQKVALAGAWGVALSNAANQLVLLGWLQSPAPVPQLSTWKWLQWTSRSRRCQSHYL